MNSVLTGVGRDLARAVPMISPATRASSEYPTRRDRLYKDHTLSACSTGIAVRSCMSQGTEGLTSSSDIHWLGDRERITPGLLA